MKPESSTASSVFLPSKLGQELILPNAGEQIRPVEKKEPGWVCNADYMHKSALGPWEESLCCKPNPVRAQGFLRLTKIRQYEVYQILTACPCLSNCVTLLSYVCWKAERLSLCCACPKIAVTGLSLTKMLPQIGKGRFILLHIRECFWGFLATLPHNFIF